MRQTNIEADITRNEGWFDGADGLRLFERAWLPGTAPRGRIVLVHGYAEHTGRYEFVGETLASAGYAVHAFDLRGHGRSDGERALVRSFDAYLDDLDVFVDRARGSQAAEPIFLLGHSMGGAIVALYAVERRPEVRGIVLSGPAVTSNAGVAAWLLRAVGRLLPRLPLMKLDAAAVSRDPEVVRRYDSDPLVYRGRVKAGLVAAMLDAGRRISAGAGSLRSPVLFMHGREDRLAPVATSETLAAAASSNDKTLKVYDGLFHEIFNEPERDSVLGDAIAWLDART
jgi:alpha-beta hydrolase superfamily lysophospholipase